MEVVELSIVSFTWAKSAGTFDWLIPLLLGFQVPMSLITLLLNYFVTLRIKKREGLVIAIETWRTTTRWTRIWQRS
jgi:hypothetical protein